MTKEFENKNQWALILGGSSGLGLATAKKLAKHGLNICIVHRSPRLHEETISKEFESITQNSIQLKTYNIDLAKPEKRQDVIGALTSTFKEDHKIKVMVHSVAKGNLKPMVSEDGNTLKHDDFEITLNAMALSLYEWTKALFEARLFADDSRIISFTSEGNTKAWQYYAAVSAAKVTLEAITRSIALEFAPYGIKANCIQAGVTDTPSLRLIPGSDDIIEHSLKRNPNRRLTTPQDVANVVYLLSKDEASWITGTIIPVDGGEHLR
ncbi:SDR family oxidoreductase [Winogradskyella sp.]|uniref:enoyl-ACP reductase FabI n=1 Tax=Winogradskyella sp. TaxID=1883156 RepID=UPI002601B609|nr:SDR family oxidoreductase [Winogradskyella sp.]